MNELGLGSKNMESHLHHLFSNFREKEMRNTGKIIIVMALWLTLPLLGEGGTTEESHEPSPVSDASKSSLQKIKSQISALLIRDGRPPEETLHIAAKHLEGSSQSFSSNSAEAPANLPIGLVPLLTQYHQAYTEENRGKKVEVQTVLDSLLEEPLEAKRAEKPSAEKDSEQKAEDVKKEIAKARKDAEERDKIRRLEDLLERNARKEEQGQQANSRSGRGSGGGDGGSGGSSPFGGAGGNPGFSNNDSSQPSSNAINQLANRINNSGSQGFGNFNSSPSTSNRRDDEKKSNFSLEPSKSSKFDFGDTSSKPKPNLSSLPKVQSAMESNAGSSAIESGSPEPLMQKSNFQGGFGGGMLGGAGSMGAGAGAAGGMGMGGGMGMMGGNMTGQQPSMASLGGGGDDFPFNITGDPMGEDESYEEGPRYRAFQVPMNAIGISGGGSEGASSEDNSGTKVALGLKNQPSLYSISEEEEALRGIPGIFRSLSSAVKKTRIQNLCSNSVSKTISLCQKVTGKSYE